MITRYVDTASTGGDGTTENLTGSTAAFASLRAALVSLGSGALSDEVTIICKASTGAADTLSVTQAHWDFETTATNRVNITVHPDHRHAGSYDDTKYRIEVTNEDAMYNNIPSHIWMTGCQHQITSSTSGDEYRCYRASTANNATDNVDHRFIDCIAKCVRTGGTSTVYGWHNSAPGSFSGTARLFNPLAVDGTYGFGSDGSGWAGTNLITYNGTGHGNNYNYINPQVCVNCIGAAPNGGGDFVATGSSGHSNNASSDDTAAGTNSRIDQVFSFVNAGAGDFRLQPTDTAAKGFGLDDPLSGLYLGDLAGVTRPVGAWSIGALEAVQPTAAVTGTITSGIDETGISGATKTIIATLTDETLVPAAGSTAIEFVANALGGTTTTTSFSITLPATQAGDILILEFAHRGTGDGTIGGTSVSVGGLTWTLKHSQLFGSSAFSGKTYWTRATGDHDGQTVTGADLTNSCASVVTQYRGALASGDPLADATIVGEENASGDETQAEITTATDGAMVVLAIVSSPDTGKANQSCTSPGTLTERAERLSTGGTDTAVTHASAVKATAGATGAFTWTQANIAGGSWAYAIQPNATTPFADARAAARSGLVSAQSEATGWNARRDTIIALTDIVRTSDTVLTITTTADAGYDITAQEVIEWTIPASILTGGSAIVATPTFTIDPAGGAGAELAGTSSITLIASAILATAITLSGQATGSVSATNNLTTAIPLASSASLTATASSALTTAIRLVGASTASVSTASSLTTAIRLTGSAPLALTASGVLTGTAAALTGAASLTVTATAAMEAVGAALAGTASVAVTTASSLTTGIALSGSSALSVSTVSALTTQIRLVGASNLALTASGAMEAVGAPLSGTASLVLSTASSLSTAIRLSGAATTALTGTSSLTTGIRLAGASALSLTASGVVTGTAAALQGTSTAALTTIGDLTTAIRFTGVAAGTVTSTSTLTTAIRLAGAAALNLTTTASLAPAIEPTANVVIHVRADDVVIGIGADDVAVTVRADDVVMVA